MPPKKKPSSTRRMGFQRIFSFESAFVADVTREIYYYIKERERLIRCCFAYSFICCYARNGVSRSHFYFYDVLLLLDSPSNTRKNIVLLQGRRKEKTAIRANDLTFLTFFPF